jgi:hypothetical protein
MLQLFVPTNVIVGWKKIIGTNTLAYFDGALVAKKKSFTILTTQWNGLK